MGFRIALTLVSGRGGRVQAGGNRGGASQARVTSATAEDIAYDVSTLDGKIRVSNGHRLIEF